MHLIHQLSNLIVLMSGIYHLVLGTACLIGSKYISKIVSNIYSMNFLSALTPMSEYMLRPLGAFAIWASLITFLAYVQINQPWVTFFKLSLSFLFLVRASFRVVYKDVLHTTFNISWERSKKNIIFNIFISSILIIDSISSLNI